MIIIYPMLVSKAVSENITPGIAKTLEAFLLVHSQDSIMSSPEAKRVYNFKLKGKKIVAKEEEIHNDSSVLRHQNRNEKSRAEKKKQENPAKSRRKRRRKRTMENEKS